MCPPSSSTSQEPHGRLNAIKDYHGELNGSYDWWDAASPMTAIGAAPEAASHVAAWLGALERPVDPWDEIVKPRVGDWAGLRAAADVLNNVRWAVNDVGINLQWASQGCQEVWHGNAGDAASVHLMKLVRPFEEAHEPIGDLAEQYRVASEEMIALHDAVVNILKSIGDAAIEAARRPWRQAVPPPPGSDCPSGSSPARSEPTTSTGWPTGSPRSSGGWTPSSRPSRLFVPRFTGFAASLSHPFGRLVTRLTGGRARPF